MFAAVSHGIVFELPYRTKAIKGAASLFLS
jgi:hypothetical protein